MDFLAIALTMAATVVSEKLWSMACRKSPRLARWLH